MPEDGNNIQFSCETHICMNIKDIHENYHKIIEEVCPNYYTSGTVKHGLKLKFGCFFSKLLAYRMMP